MNDEILATANEISQIAAETALSYFRKTLDVSLKGDYSPVTAADIQIEQEARDLLGRQFPEHSILGEEFGAGDMSKEHVWVIDPIDGTRSFISGHSLFGFLLAYLKGGVSQLCVVSIPVLGERYVGRLGHAATLNGTEIKTSDTAKLCDAILYINEGEKIFANEHDLHARLVTAGHTRRFGYDCYPHALLAAGHVDAVVDYDAKSFDYLPLAGLIEAAGGFMTDWSGKPLNFASDGRVISAATLELHREMLHLPAKGS